MAELVYLLCTVTSLVCAGLLLRNYRRYPVRLTLWTSLCFIALAANNILLFVDLVIVPATALSVWGVGLATWRAVVGLAGVAILLSGMIWEAS